jgi:TP901 family phage tail tape measure protein
VLHGKVDGFMSSMKRASGAASGFDKSMTGAHTSVASFGAGVAAIGVGMAAFSINEAAKYQAAMANVAAYTNNSTTEVKKANAALLQMAPAVGVGPVALAKAFLIASSTNLGYAKSLEVTRYAAQASASGLGTAEAVTLALGSAMTAYAKTGLTARQAADYFTSAVKESHVPIDQLASKIGLVSGNAAALGIKFPEVIANLAAMTRVSGNAANASTSFNSVILSLTRMVNPSKQVASALAELGTTGTAVATELRDKGLRATLQDLTDRNKVYAASHGGLNTAMVKLFPNVRSLRDIFGTAGLAGDQYKASIDRVQHSTDGNGDAARAFAQIQGTLAFQMKQATAAVDAFAIKIGSVLLPVVSSAINFAMHHKEIMKDLAFAIGVVAVGAVGLFTASLLTNPAVLFTAGIVATIAALKHWYDTSRDGRRIITEVFAKLLEAAHGFFNPFLDGLSTLIGAAASFADAMGFHGMAKKLHHAADAVEGFRHSLNATMDKIVAEGKAKTEALGVDMTEPLWQQVPHFQAIATKYHTTLAHVLDEAGMTATRKAQILGYNVADGMSQTIPKTVAVAARLAAIVPAALRDSDTRAAAIAYATGQGLADGIRTGIASRIKDTVAYAKSAGEAAARAIRLGGGVASPSKLTHYTGQMLGEGLITGLNSRAADVAAAARALGLSTATYLRLSAEQASGGGHSQSHHGHGPGSRGGHPYVRHPRQHGPIRDVYGTYVTADAKYLAQVKRHNEAVALSHEHMQQRILRAHEAAVKAALILSKRHARALIEDAQEAGRKMLTAAKTALTGQQDAIKSMMTDLDGLKKERDSFAAGIASGITSGFGDILGIFTELTRGSTEAKKALDATAAAVKNTTDHYADLQAQAASYTHITVAQQQNLTDAATAVTAATDAATAAQVAYNTATAAAGDPVKQLTQTLTDQLAKTKKFSTDLQTLTAQGAGKDLIEKLAKAGADSGDALASALLAAGPGAVKNINDLMAGIADAGKTAGDAIAGQYYDQGINSMQHLIDGMQLKEKALQDEVNRVNAILASLGAAKEAVNQATNTKGVNTAVGSVGLGKPSGHAPVVVHKGAVTVHVTSPQVTPAHVTAAVNTGMRQLATMIQSGRAR